MAKTGEKNIFRFALQGNWKYTWNGPISARKYTKRGIFYNLLDTSVGAQTVRRTEMIYK